MSDAGIQQRRFPRYHCGVDVITYQGGNTAQSRITQISRGGCLIFPPLPPIQASELRLSFRLANELPYINCKGEIVYSVNDRGSGVAFREISLYNQDLITDYFEKQLAAEQSAGA